MDKFFFGLGSLLVLVLFNASIVQKERVLKHGNRILLELAPKDPRSLMQGDYMVLRYRISQKLNWNRKYKKKRRGFLVMTKKGSKTTASIATFVRMHKEKLPLKKGEFLLEYHLRKGSIYLGAESFFFQEGFGKCFENDAKYGELRVDTSGKSVLVGLRNRKQVAITTKACKALLKS